MRKINNPIALYAKHFKGYIAENKTKIAFDFKIGDFVQPFGHGIAEDIYIYFNGYSKSFIDYGGEITISFPGITDGLISLENESGYYSDFKLPYSAPDGGYMKNKILVRKRKGKGKDTIKENNLNRKNNFGYFLRVNSKADLNGNITQANYVKINGEITFDPRSEGKGAAYIELTYYLNPTPNDRNLEFDPQQNLFKNLKHEEKVWKP